MLSAVQVLFMKSSIIIDILKRPVKSEKGTVVANAFLHGCKVDTNLDVEPEHIGKRLIETTVRMTH